MVDPSAELLVLVMVNSMGALRARLVSEADGAMDVMKFEVKDILTVRWKE